MGGIFCQRLFVSLDRFAPTAQPLQIYPHLRVDIPKRPLIALQQNLGFAEQHYCRRRIATLPHSDTVIVEGAAVIRFEADSAFE